MAKHRKKGPASPNGIPAAVPAQSCCACGRAAPGPAPNPSGTRGAAAQGPAPNDFPRPFTPTPKQQAYLDALKDRRDATSIRSLCDGPAAVVARSTLYTWQKDPAFNAWLGRQAVQHLMAHYGPLLIGCMNAALSGDERMRLQMLKFVTDPKGLTALLERTGFLAAQAAAAPPSAAPADSAPPAPAEASAEEPATPALTTEPAPSAAPAAETHSGEARGRAPSPAGDGTGEASGASARERTRDVPDRAASDRQRTRATPIAAPVAAWADPPPHDEANPFIAIAARRARRPEQPEADATTIISRAYHHLSKLDGMIGESDLRSAKRAEEFARRVLELRRLSDAADNDPVHDPPKFFAHHPSAILNPAVSLVDDFVQLRGFRFQRRIQNGLPAGELEEMQLNQLIYECRADIIAARAGHVCHEHLVTPKSIPGEEYFGMVDFHWNIDEDKIALGCQHPDPPNGPTCLEFLNSFAAGDIETARRGLAAGLPIHLRSTNYLTPFSIAARNKQNEMLEFAFRARDVEVGIDPHALDDYFPDVQPNPDYIPPKPAYGGYGPTPTFENMQLGQR